MRLNGIKGPKARKALSTNFLARAVQDFAEVKCHDDWALSTIFVLRTKPNNWPYTPTRQSRYAF